MVIGIIHNVSILLALSMLHYLFARKSEIYYKGIREIILGIIIGFIGVILMMTPWTLQPGLVFDTRTVLLSVCGLIIGPIPTIIGMATTSLYRIYMAGDGIVMGVATILTSGSVGILWGALRPRWYERRMKTELLLMGILTHILMLCCIIFLPKELRESTFRNIAPTVLIVYPVGSMLLGIVLMTNKERRESIRRFTEAEERKTTFFNASNDMMYIKDENFRYIDVNDAICSFFNRDKDEILGRTDEELMSGQNLEDVILSDNQVINGLATIKIEERFGDKIYEATKFPIKLESEKYGIGGIVRNLTDVIKTRNVQEAVLNISKSSLKEQNLTSFSRNIHEQLGRVIPVKNIYIAMYDKETDLYSYPYYVDEFDTIEDGFTETLPGSLTDYVRRSGQSKLITNEIRSELQQDGLVFSRFGTETPSFVWIGAPLFDSEFKDVIGVIVVQDYYDQKAYNSDDLALLEIFANNIGLFIERIKNVENLREAKLKAEESDRLKTAFLANMSHEIRTPMNGIMGFANILLDEVTDETHHEYLEIISKSADRLLATINDVLDISRIETGQVCVTKSEFDINDMFRELHSFFKVNNSHIDVLLMLERNEPMHIYTDKTKFQQVMINLLGNAVKFTRKGSVEFGYSVGISNITIYVKDTGIGIPEASREVIFDRFVQANSSALREFEGTGLGLAISKLFVELLGGRIWLTSEVGVGTTFFVSLPVN